MITEIFNQLKTDIQEGIANLEITEQYNGEFEEGSEWNPRSSACFLQLTGFRPAVKHADGSFGKYSVTFKVYAGANTKHGKNAMELTESLITLLNGSKLTIEESGLTYTCSIAAEGMDFILYQMGFEAYSFSLTVV